VRVHWTDTAREHLRALQTYIAQNSPQYALRMVDRLTRRSQQIGEFPFSGRAVPEFEHARVREVLEGPYRLIYYLKSDQVDVLAVIHSAQEIPKTR
jgi:toxin ParE1/3/4